MYIYVCKSIFMYLHIYIHIFSNTHTHAYVFFAHQFAHVMVYCV